MEIFHGILDSAQLFSRKSYLLGDDDLIFSEILINLFHRYDYVTLQFLSTADKFIMDFK